MNMLALTIILPLIGFVLLAFSRGRWSENVSALDWLGYASLPKLDYQSESLVNEIYRGEDN